jgi:hypothetical protein
MNYEQWRDELFGLPPESDPVTYDHSDDFYAVPPHEAFDYVDQVLVDPNVHSLFSKDQLGKSINTIYSNSCSDLPSLYTSESDEDRRIIGINNLINLYRNYFDKHCTGDLPDGSYSDGGPMGYICYMFWDVFILYPGNAIPAMISAAISVMRTALGSRNDSSLASAIHGLGHRVFDVPEAAITLKHWIQKPTTDNPVVLQYARTATSGMIE